MVKVLQQEKQLLVESPLNRFGRLAVVADEIFGPEKLHQAGRFAFPALCFPAC